MKKIQVGGHKKSKIKGYTIVDDVFFEWLNQWKWSYDNGYASREIIVPKDNTRIFMHRLIMNTPDEMYTDHINGDKLDNRRNNLRICTRSQNQYNVKERINNTSGYKGVCWNKRRGKWVVNIKYNGKNICLGYFNNRIEAARSYNQKAIELHKEFANF